MKAAHWVATVIGAMSIGICAAPAVADDGAFYGLLRSRDLTPFGFLRLDLRAAHAVSIEPGSWALETEVGYQNTWALSPEVERYLTDLESQGRRDLGPADLQAIQDLPGENYLVDVESALLDVTFHYKFSTNWTGYLTASAISYQGGFLDSAIEKFHDSFGFSTFGRPAARRNDANLIYDLKSGQVAFFGTPTDGGMTDPTVGLRYVGTSLPAPWKLSLEAAVKVPVAGRRLLLSTGRTDYGIQASLQRFGRHHALYLDLAGVYYAGAGDPVPQESQFVPTLIFGYESGCAPPDESFPVHLRHHREPAEHQQHARHRISAGSRLRAASGRTRVEVESECEADAATASHAATRRPDSRIGYVPRQPKQPSGDLSAGASEAAS